MKTFKVTLTADFSLDDSSKPKLADALRAGGVEPVTIKCDRPMHTEVIVAVEADTVDAAKAKALAATERDAHGPGANWKVEAVAESLGWNAESPPAQDT